MHLRLPHINEDVGREHELMMAKLQPYDGETTYVDIEGTEHLGYGIVPYHRAHRRQLAIAIGSTIVRHCKINTTREQTPPRPWTTTDAENFHKLCDFYADELQEEKAERKFWEDLQRRDEIR